MCQQRQILRNVFSVDAADFYSLVYNRFPVFAFSKFKVFFVAADQLQFVVSQPNGKGDVVNQILKLNQSCRGFFFFFFQPRDFVCFITDVAKPDHVAVNVAVKAVNAGTGQPQELVAAFEDEFVVERNAFVPQQTDIFLNLFDIVFIKVF